MTSLLIIAPAETVSTFIKHALFVGHPTKLNVYRFPVWPVKRYVLSIRVYAGLLEVTYGLLILLYG
jgi:hypothetical protein